MLSRLLLDADEFTQLVETAVQSALEKMSTAKQNARPESFEKLALGGREAAIVVSISPRLLWDNTWPRGPIRAIRVGSRVLYPVNELRRWIDAQTNLQGQQQTFGHAPAKVALIESSTSLGGN